MRSRNLITALLFSASLAVFSGCTPQDDVAYVEDENARLKQLLIQYENDARNNQVMVADANSRVERANLELDAANRKISVYESEIPRLRNIAANAASTQFVSTSRGMSEKVAQQLSDLAQQFGGAVVGNRLELPGDFFFDSGQYTLNPNARAAIRRMAEILAGENLMLMVVGYTDNDPIRNPNLRSKGVNDNLHLSLLRAKSVVDELRKAGYPPTMMYPTGWGEIRPIVPNTDRAAKRLNRRVDILIDPIATSTFGMSSITGVEPIAMR